MLVLMILAAVWAAVLLPPFLRNHRDNRPGSSVLDFRAQLSTLERATPGTSLRVVGPNTTVRRAPVPAVRADVRRRRRDVLVGLLGATAFTLLLAVAVGGALITLLFLATAGACGAYVYALRQIKLRAMERSVKVRPLRPAARAITPRPALALRPVASR